MRILYVLALLQILIVPASAEPLFDLVVLADESGSMGSAGFQTEKNFAVQTALGLTFGPTDTAASFLLYGAAPRIILNLTTNKTTYINSVNSAVYAQSPDSDMASGLTLAQNQFNTHGRTGAHKILALLGDGMPDLNNDGIDPKLNELAAAGVHVFPIVGGASPSIAFMEPLVRNEGQLFLLVPNPAAAFVGAMNAIAAPALTGDYNDNHAVDVADFTVWRDTLGSTADLRANGDDSNSVIDTGDYQVWKKSFGSTNLAAAATPVPEPSVFTLAVIGVLFGARAVGCGRQ